MMREQQILTEIEYVLQCVGDELTGYRVVLFGSRAAGTAGPRSDFDIGVMGGRGLPLKTFYKIQDMFDQIETLYSIDWVDLNDTRDEFRKEAMKYVKVLYG
ncbi:MAG: nucleotidyltransferase domain-containing protein [Spartobacteria bacterium]|nr:nucleotidyltransferase domain-containing protein [Spartobacteria bacterium]